VLPDASGPDCSGESFYPELSETQSPAFFATCFSLYRNKYFHTYSLEYAISFSTMQKFQIPTEQFRVSPHDFFRLLSYTASYF
jgi:hypothetical protein